jgi:hypothetical protein
MPVRRNLVIQQGKTFSLPTRWETAVQVYVPISGVTLAAPAVVTTSIVHGLVAGWRAAIVSVLGMTEINAHVPVRSSDYHPVTVVDTTHVNFNDINASGFTPYVSGGYLQFYAPQSLAGMIARLTIKDRIGGNVLHAMTSVGGSAEITVDDTAKVITPVIASEVTAAFTWLNGVYDFEAEDGSGVVTELAYGSVVVDQEVTT